MNQGKILGKIKQILPILIIICYGLYHGIYSFCNDYFFDIRSGKDLFKYGLDFKDHFSFIPNLYYYYHHFLYDILLYSIHNVFGNTGTFIFFNLLIITFLLILYYYSKSIFKNNFFALVIVCVTFYLSFNSFSSRVQSLSIILLLLEYIFLEKLSSTGKNRYILYIFALSCLFVNMHMPIWPLFPAMILPYFADIIISKVKLKWIKDKFIFEKVKSKKKLFITFILVLLSPLVSPFGFLPYVFYIIGRNEPFYNQILELQVPVLGNGIILYIVLLMSIIFLLSKKIKIRFKDICYLLGLSIFGFMAVRNLLYIRAFCPIIIFYIIDFNIDVRSVFKYLYSRFISRFEKKVIYVLSIGTIAVIFLTFYVVYYNLEKKYSFHKEEFMVQESANYIIENIDYKNKRIFTDFDVGSYFAYKGIPTFIDSRAEVFMKSYNGGYDIFYDYMNLSSEPFLEKYQFDYLVVSKITNFYRYLNKSSDYNSIFNDNDMYYIFERVK